MATSACNIDSCPPENDTPGTRPKNQPENDPGLGDPGLSDPEAQQRMARALGLFQAEPGGCAGAVSRRFLLSAAATVPALGLTLPALAAPATAGADLNVALLAERYRRSADALSDWIETVEYRYGCHIQEQPEHRARYRELCDREDQSMEALARARPSSVRGVVFKLRPAFYCDSLCRAGDDHIEPVLMAALRDLERLAAGPA